MVGITDQMVFDEVNKKSQPREASNKIKYSVDNNICFIITKKNLTQVDLAQMVGVKREYINRIINRKITPTVPLAMGIAKALKVSVEEVFTLIEEGG